MPTAPTVESILSVIGPESAAILKRHFTAIFLEDMSDVLKQRGGIDLPKKATKPKQTKLTKQSNLVDAYADVPGPDEISSSDAIRLMHELHPNLRQSEIYSYLHDVRGFKLSKPLVNQALKGATKPSKAEKKRGPKPSKPIKQAGKRKLSKDGLNGSQFIREFDKKHPGKKGPEVVEAGKKAGLTIALPQVYNVRRAEKLKAGKGKKPGKKAAKKASKR